ncbi:hypothetical protein HON22_05965 [Candidatus Peregrinibacteria bacterium]|jgi:hypothetical protein|nr:hypothetical protein [Candidatus Peregrinibacteria bacterium]
MYLYQKIIAFFVAIILVVFGGFFAYTKIFKGSFAGIENVFTEKKDLSQAIVEEVEVKNAPALVPQPVVKKIYNRIDAVNGMVIDFNLNRLEPPLFFKVSGSSYEKLSPSYLLKLEEEGLMNVRKSLDDFGVFILKDGSYTSIN